VNRGAGNLRLGGGWVGVEGVEDVTRRALARRVAGLRWGLYGRSRGLEGILGCHRGDILLVLILVLLDDTERIPPERVEVSPAEPRGTNRSDTHVRIT